MIEKAKNVVDVRKVMSSSLLPSSYPGSLEFIEVPGFFYALSQTKGFGNFGRFDARLMHAAKIIEILMHKRPGDYPGRFSLSSEYFFEFCRCLDVVFW